MLSNFGETTVQLDKAKLESPLSHAIVFQQQHNVHIWVGEFSAIRWAGDAAQWIVDAIEIFEKYNWDWTYHAYKGWNGWNHTFTATDGRIITPMVAR